MGSWIIPNTNYWFYEYDCWNGINLVMYMTCIHIGYRSFFQNCYIFLIQYNFSPWSCISSCCLNYLSPKTVRKSFLHFLYLHPVLFVSIIICNYLNTIFNITAGRKKLIASSSEAVLKPSCGFIGILKKFTYVVDCGR